MIWHGMAYVNLEKNRRKGFVCNNDANMAKSKEKLAVKKMRNLKGFERTYLRGLAHSLKPVVQIGKSGLKNEVVVSIEEAFSARELIKIKFNEFKEEKKSPLKRD